MTISELKSICDKLIEKGYEDKEAFVQMWTTDGEQNFTFHFPCNSQIIGNDLAVCIGTFDYCIANMRGVASVRMIDTL